ncbi:hypothetical protein AVEN_11690-1, partial [Araneus ventricosus]
DLDDIPQTPPEEHLSLPMQNENRKSCILRSYSQAGMVMLLFIKT